MDGLQEDSGDGSMLCTEHPFKNNTPAGGICAFCLQEKLGKLVSSSFPIAVFPSSSSSSPSFRSDIGTTTTTLSSSSGVVPPPRLTNSNSTNTIINPSNCHYHDNIHNHHSHSHSNRSRILYLLGQKKKKKKDLGDGVHSADRNNNLVFKRSKSTAAVPRRLHYMNGDIADGMTTTTTTTPHKRGFWSFLYLQKHSNSSSINRKTFRDISSNSMRASVASSFANVHRSQPTDNIIVVEENGSPCHASFDRKVSRSRSVGCGSRSFSGDFFERISTGFGDCTLRRVESQREGKVKPSTIRSNGQDCIQERARCGGLFSGFMITSSSSSSSSSSNWVGSNTNEGNVTGKVTSAAAGTGQHSRSKSWGWALASPMRAFSKPASSKKKNPTPNLNAIPSLLSVGS
ncbi:hypothetical protein Hanom_Chr03g00271821 [Helianthus anomalus]